MNWNAQNVKNFIRKHYKKAVSVTVIATLGTVCFISVTGERMRESSEYGRMIAISNIEAETPFESETQKISYDELVTMCYESDQLAKIEKSEKNYEAVLLSEKQEAKDKAAFDALTKQEKQEAAEKEKAERAKAAAEAAQNTPAAAPTVAYTPADSASSGEYLGTFVVTAYCPCAKCCGKSTGITASGTQATAGRTIAADGRFPFGTQLVIDGNVYTVEDRGSAVKGNHIDMFFSTHQEAVSYGRRTVDVYAY